MMPFELTMCRPENLRTSDFLRISQTAASAHLEALGLTGVLEARGLVWVIIRIRGEIYKPLPQRFTVQTWPGIRQKGFLPRYCRILDGEEVVANMVTLWVLADAKSRTLSLDTDPGVPELVTGWELPIPRSLKRKTMEKAGEFSVKPQWIDGNGHMNNCCYLDAAEETLGLSAIPGAFSVDYRHELLPEQRTAVCARWEENTLCLSGQGETECFRMKLEYEGGTQ